MATRTLSGTDVVYYDIDTKYGDFELNTLEAKR